MYRQSVQRHSLRPSPPSSAESSGGAMRAPHGHTRMTTLVRYLTHPQVQIDPHVPVPSWRLSGVGAARVQALITAGWLAGTTLVVSSAEQKALETAEPLAAALGIPLEIREEMHENDRSATGFLAPVEFASVANEFFAYPNQSIRGWERAVDAQPASCAKRSRFSAGSMQAMCFSLGTA